VIKAKLIFTENKEGIVETEIVSYPGDGTETEREIYMLATFMGFNICLSNVDNFESLMRLLKSDIDAVVKGAND
jgi:hypothetical protein